MAKKNKKRGKNLVKSARRKKREYLQKMTPKERKQYEKRRKQNAKIMYDNYDYKLSFKECVAVALVIIFFLGALFTIGYLIYLGIHFLIHNGG